MKNIIGIIISIIFVVILLVLMVLLILRDIKISKKLYKNRNTMIVYWFLRAQIAYAAIRSIMVHNYENLLLCLMTIILFSLPSLIERRLKISFPTPLEIIILLFIFAHEILGELGAFYVKVQGWDTMLHTLSGFLLAAIGFCLFDLLNRNNKVKLKLSPFYLSLVAFCFSMTVGVIWEFVEHTSDWVFKTDMQKDTMVQEIDSVYLDPTNSNEVIKYNNIDKTIVYTSDGKVLELDGYLDIGLNDTMKDLFVCFIGATTFSIIGYFYTKNGGKSIATLFIPTIETAGEN